MTHAVMLQLKTRELIDLENKLWNLHGLLSAHRPNTRQHTNLRAEIELVFRHHSDLERSIADLVHDINNYVPCRGIIEISDESEDEAIIENDDTVSISSVEEEKARKNN